MKNLFFLISVFACGACFAGQGPSFDCGKASTEVERIICSSDHLSEKDREMSRLYSAYVKGLPADARDAARRMQNLWLANRNCTDTSLPGCVTRSYIDWLSVMERGIFRVSVPLVENGAAVISPFDPDVRYFVRFIADPERNTPEEKNGAMEFYLTDKGSENILFRDNFYADGRDLYYSKITRMYFYMAKNGTRHVAIKRYNRGLGGRCDDYSGTYLDFLDFKEKHKPIKSITLEERDDACGTYEKELFRWEVKDNGNIIFYSLAGREVGPWARKFIETKGYEIDSESGSYRVHYWIDESEESFRGIAYEEISERVIHAIGDSGDVGLDGECVNPDFLAVDYLRFKDAVSRYGMGFHQIDFYARNFLDIDKLAVALKYKPLLEAALDYLEKIRAMDGWKEKLVAASGKYPELRVTSNFYYSHDAEWEINPFVESGFYSDEGCYAGQHSPWGFASMEEWYYLFWARRIKDGQLERTESFLKLIIGMMDAYEKKNSIGKWLQDRGVVVFR